MSLRNAILVRIIFHQIFNIGFFSVPPGGIKDRVRGLRIAIALNALVRYPHHIADDMLQVLS